MDCLSTSTTVQDPGCAAGYLTIDLGALARNYKRLAREVAPAQVAAVVKADAYGLGADRVASRLYAEGCRHFFVAHFIEAMRLRPFLADDASIMVLNGLLPGNEGACIRHRIVPVINSLEQWRRWADAAGAADRVLPAVLQFDTGMSRLGIPPDERHTLAGLVQAERRVAVLFVMSHLACADDLDSAQNSSQLTEMRAVAADFPQFELSFANSAGIFLGTPYHGAVVRPGIALYGGATVSGQVNPMEPVVSLEISVLQTRTVHVGARVGYGGDHAISTETRIATIAAGYADGLPRSLSGRGAVYCDGIRLNIIGRVSMDSITIDISALPEGRITHGRLVQLLGHHQSLEDVARDAGTISYEILTGLGNRYQRTYR